jgi:hypothetical protein
MALIVEDGTARPDAEAYISVANASAYFAARNNATWAALASDAVREGCLRLGAEYMTQAYRGRWKGYRVSAAQALDWPRQSITIEDSVLNAYVPFTSVPIEVQRANAELALMANSGALAPNLERGVLAEQIGPLKVDYDSDSPQYTRYRVIDLMLSIYLLTTGASTPLVRS